MSFLTGGQACAEDQSVRVMEEAIVTDVYRALYCQGLSAQCHPQLMKELEAP